AHHRFHPQVAAHLRYQRMGNLARILPQTAPELLGRPKWHERWRTWLCDTLSPFTLAECWLVPSPCERACSLRLRTTKAPVASTLTRARPGAIKSAFGEVSGLGFTRRLGSLSLLFALAAAQAA